MTSNVKLIDPVQGLIDYVLDIKPYHTKIVEVLVDHVGQDIAKVAIREDNEWDIQVYYSDTTFEPLPCDTGFGAVSYGDGKRFLVLSPNPSVSFETYPAIDAGTNTIIVMGNQTGNIQVGDHIFLATHIEDLITSAVAGPGGQFVVLGNQTAIYTPGFIFSVTDSSSNNGNYTVVSSVVSASNTVITVAETVTASTPGGFIRFPSNNIGNFTVSNVEYFGGTIDSWVDVSNPSTYKLGDNPHTKITVEEPLSMVPTLSANQTYTAFITTDALTVIGALSYSNFIRRYNPFQQTPDEGSATFTILGAVASTFDLLGQVIPNSGSFTVAGNHSGSNLFVDDSLVVTQSTDNNGVYTITSISYSDVLDQTTFGVAEQVSSSTTAGSLTIVIPSNVFIVSGNKQARFIQGTLFSIVSGTNVGTYTTLTSRYIPSQNVTWIRTVESTISNLGGSLVTSVVVGSGSPLISKFVIQGDLVSSFGVGTRFNVIGSNSNDGQYTVASPGATLVGGSTHIPVDGIVDSSAGGEIFPFAVGFLKYFPYGFGHGAGLCRYVPGTHAHVRIDEQIFFSGASLKLTDDIVAYNLENTDSWGYNLPALTLFSDTQPSVTFMTEFPGDPTRPNGAWPEPRPMSIFPYRNALWFDMTAHVLKQYTGNNYTESLNVWTWTIVPKAYWYNTITRNMHYRIVEGTGSPYTDTGWVLDFAVTPGFSNVVPAVGKKTVISTEGFSVPVSGTTTFTLSSAVPSAEYLYVTVNDVPASFTLDSPTSFTIVSPTANPSDGIMAYIYQDALTETNAFVSTFDSIPHTAYHDQVTADVVNNVFEIGGGNFIARFEPSTSFVGINTTTGSMLGTWIPTTYTVTSVSVNTLTVSGNLTWLFAANRVIRMVHSNLTVADYTIQSSSFTGTDTVIMTTTQLVDQSTGFIYGAVFNQANTTFVVPTTPVDQNVTSVAYSWAGPLRFTVGFNPTETPSLTVVDTLGLSDELVGLAGSFNIIDTNAAANTFTLHHVDSLTGLPVNLTDIFTPGYVFTVANSYSNGSPLATNDAKYVVASSYFDWVGSPPTGTGHTIVTIETNYNNIPPFNSFNVLSIVTGSINTITLQGDHTTLLQTFTSGQFKLDQPIISTDPLLNVLTVASIQLVGGNTVISFTGNVINSLYTGPLGLIEVSYSGDIAYDASNVVGPWNNGIVLSETLRASTGTVNLTATTISDTLSFGWGSYYEWAIVGANIGTNTIYIASDVTTVVDPNETCAIVGSLGLNGTHQVVSATYSAGSGTTAVVLTPALPNVVMGSPAQYGYFRLDQIDVTEWFQYLIKEMNANTNVISVNGNATSAVQVGQQFRVTGTLTNNTTFTSNAALVYNSANDTTAIAVTEPINFGTALITYIVSANTIRVQGNVAQYLSGSDLVYVTGSTSNNGMYVVSGVVYDVVTNTTEVTLQLGSPGLNFTADGTLEFYQRGGWIESWKFLGMNLIFNDGLNVGVAESSNAAVLSDSGSLVDSFDYPFWNIVSYDENLGTVIHLYSGTFLV